MKSALNDEMDTEECMAFWNGDGSHSCGAGYRYGWEESRCSAKEWHPAAQSLFGKHISRRRARMYGSSSGEDRTPWS
eukprot:634471-Amphidinium_carterae.1